MGRPLPTNVGSGPPKHSNNTHFLFITRTAPLASTTIFINGQGPLEAVIGTGSTVNFIPRHLLPPGCQLSQTTELTIETILATQTVRVQQSVLHVSSEAMSPYEAVFITPAIGVTWNFPHIVLRGTEARCALKDAEKIEIHLTPNEQCEGIIAPAHILVRNGHSTTVEEQVTQGVQEELERNSKVQGTTPLGTFKLEWKTSPPTSRLEPRRYMSQARYVEQVEELFNEHIKAGNMRLATEKELSSGSLRAIFNTLVVVTTKEDGSTKLRAVIDPRLLNPSLKVPESTLPGIIPLLRSIPAGQVFTKIDLTDAFRSVRVTEEDQCYLAQTYNNKTYVHLTAPYGVSTVPEHFSNHSVQGLHLVTDHQALTYLLDTLPSRVLNGWAAAIRDHVLSVEWTPGANNVVADALSRRPDYAEELARVEEALLSPAGDYPRSWKSSCRG